MRHTTVIDQTLVDAYLETHYRVHADPPFILRIGVTSDTLRKLHRLYGGNSVFITACNPYSQQLSEQENQARQDHLKADLVAAGCIVTLGVGLHPSNRWPGEPSFLAIGIDAETAIALGRKYEQNAIVCNEASGKSELVLLR